VTGDEVGVVANRGPDAGRAALLVDGAAVALMDLWAAEPGGPEIVHVATLAPGPHTVAIQPTDSADPGSTGTAVDVTGFVTITGGAPAQSG
jgi:hypothetical protein